MDREIKSVYNFLIESFDNGYPLTQRNWQNVSVIILDEDDNLPKFKIKTIEKFYLPENCLIETFLTQIEYFDLDQVFI